jgi:integrase/recombinase XerD
MENQAASYRQALEAMEQKLITLRYSDSTVNTYRYMFREFLKQLYPLPLHKVTVDDIKAYHYQLVTQKKVSRSYQNQSINAIKFYLEHVMGLDRTRYELERPQKEQKLPTVLSQQEVQKLFREVNNLKHLAILMTIYSCGLRISELLNLEIRDIDSGRMEVRIRGGKGKKDRITVLSPHLLGLLRKYFKKHRPEKFLFEGQKGGPYSTSSIRSILERAVKKAGIRKNVVVHTLRHSYGTHLLENGTNLRYIQVLMGHSSSKTTEIYTHVAQSDIHKVKSPLDHLDTEGYI